ncbi:putative type VI secretion-associated protein, ImpA family [Methylocaldum marinum]|uniref:Putative type VI secretion-associated protein, ImpA family n=1 Tax=Methylocaldum marinum TaxID=1432792 RepID=A0A250KNK4_9GAMM|nr:type VI secretion system protein TssA [Methylocaldum marinum]BBA33154.1 putative type VI secretion-associated protein, ImpA family [Methylocaldum marinum]
MGEINIEAFLTEVSSDAPCGEDLQYDSAFIELEQKIKGTPEQQIGDRIEPAQPPNWKEVRQDAVELLRRTRDLQVILYLIQALLQTEGYSGLRDGLVVLEGVVRKFWPQLYPLLDPEDDNDPTHRVNILLGLCDFETILRPVALMPLVESRALGSFSLRDVQIATGKLPAPSDESTVHELAAVKAAFMDADTATLESTRLAIAASLASLKSIESFVTDQVGVGDAPNFAPLRNVLKEVQQVFGEYMESGSSGDEQPETEAESVPAPDSVVKTAAVRPGEISNRQDVIKTLELICDYYARCEPSSPIPLLLTRAKRLVLMDFIEIIKDLAPDGLSQVELIKGREPSEDSQY